MSVIWWIRRDFRLGDNAALHHAWQESPHVIPLFILDPMVLNYTQQHRARLAFMGDGLRVLAGDLERIGGKLIIHTGKPEEVLPAFVKHSRAESVHFNRDYSPYATRRDAWITQLLEAQGVRVYSHKDLVIHEAHEVLSKDEKPYSVYSPFRRVWESLPKPEVLPRPKQFSTPAGLHHEGLAALAPLKTIPAPVPIVMAGEGAALVRLQEFLRESVGDYKDGRNIPGVDGTSRLSPYLRWGMISPRTAYWQAQAALREAKLVAERESLTAWINELVWREFFYQVLAHNPHVTNGAYRREFDQIAWENSAEHLHAWQTGHTGYPIVDAGMRQLNQTGWMHNRLRMITASFLCKDLLISWQEGERYFMRQLIDGDLAQNNGGWQWTAGTGTDAAPYFRVFNPTAQGQKFDPDGKYIRHWVPELANVPVQYIQEPHTMPHALQEKVGCVIDKDYPAPIVDHAVQRERALALYSRIKQIT
jgi:deoxyribodipyrimidine photo-lyase